MAKMVSIIVPVYNVEQYLERMITSILSQTYQYFELILIDDGSTDSSLDICHSYTDPRIKVLEQKNAGVSVARNKGMSVAKGDYIIFVDSDDSVEPEMLQKLMNYPHREDELIIYGYYIHNEDKSHEITKNAGNSEYLELTAIDVANNFWTYYSEGLINSPCNKLYRASIIKNNHLSFPNGVKMGEDLIFNLTYFTKVRRFKIVEDYFYHYYLYPTQSSRQVHLGIADDMILFLKKIESYIENEQAVLTEHHDQIVKHLITALTMAYRTTDISNSERLAHVKRTIQLFMTAFPTVILTNGSHYEKRMFHLMRNRAYKTIHYILLVKETSKIRLKQLMKRT